MSDSGRRASIPADVARLVAGRFPFAGYMSERLGADGVYASIGSMVSRYMPPPARLLDVGAGPCDVTAVLQGLGYQCTAVDDLQDAWHRQGDNRARILEFARSEGIDYVVAGDGVELAAGQEWDVIVMADVLEHLHESPRAIMSWAVGRLRVGGIVVVSVPNAGNVRKRIDLLRGRTNLPPFDSYYWYEGMWRGHVREYVYDDLQRLATYSGLEILHLDGADHMLARLPRRLKALYLGITAAFRGLKDSWILVGRKPPGWQVLERGAGSGGPEGPRTD